MPLTALMTGMRLTKSGVDEVRSLVKTHQPALAELDIGATTDYTQLHRKEHCARSLTLDYQWYGDQR